MIARILALAAPSAAVSAAQVFTQFAETLVAAKLGTGALAAWSITLPFVLLLQQTSAGAMGGGVSSAIARALGANDQAQACALVKHALWIALVAGLVFAIPLSIFLPWLIGRLAGDEIAQLNRFYPFAAFGLAAVPAWLVNTLSAILRGGGQHRIVGRLMVSAWLVLCIMMPLCALIFELGLAGIGLAQALVFTVAAWLMWQKVRAGQAGFVPDLTLKPQLILFKRILSVGLMACALALIANLTTFLVNARLAAFGTAYVAAYGIAARVEFLMVPVAFGVGAALTALVGHAVGSGQWQQARRIAWTGAAMAFVVTMPFGLWVAIWPDVLASFLTSDPQVQVHAATALSYLGWGLAPFAVGMTLYFASQGANRMRGPLLAGMFRISIAVGLGALLAQHLQPAASAYYLSVACAITIYGLVVALSVRPGVWSEPSVSKSLANLNDRR